MLVSRIVRVVSSIGISCALIGCGTYPALQYEDRVSTKLVLQKVECELLVAVQSAANQQVLSGGENSRRSIETFDLVNYTASIELYDKSDQTMMAQAGGHVRSDANVPYRSLAGGLSPLPGFGVKKVSYQKIQGKRTIEFGQILKKTSQNPLSYSFKKTKGFEKFHVDCELGGSVSRSANSRGGVFSSNLGIARRLSDTVRESMTSPFEIQEEIYTFDAVTTIDASGTVSVLEAASLGTLGAGVQKVFSENIVIKVGRNAS